MRDAWFWPGVQITAALLLVFGGWRLMGIVIRSPVEQLERQRAETERVDRAWRARYEAQSIRLDALRTLLALDSLHAAITGGQQCRRPR